MNISFSKFDATASFFAPISVRNTTASGPILSQPVPFVGLDANGKGNYRILKTWKGGEKMKIDLTSREVPTQGEQPGVFAKVHQTVQTDKRGRKFSYLVLVGELKATKSSGRRFTATTRFNLDDLRGLNSLRENLQIWRGSNDLPSLTDFDPEAEFVGKTFLAEPTVHDDGGKREIRFSGFKPYTGESPLTVGADFVSVNAAS